MSQSKVSNPISCSPCDCPGGGRIRFAWFYSNPSPCAGSNREKDSSRGYDPIRDYTFGSMSRICRTPDENDPRHQPLSPSVRRILLPFALGLWLLLFRRAFHKVSHMRRGRKWPSRTGSRYERDARRNHRCKVGSRDRNLWLLDNRPIYPESANTSRKTLHSPQSARGRQA